MKTKELKYLSHQVTPGNDTILWLTDGQVTPDSKGFYEMNYLLDGLLSSNFSQQKNQQEQKHHVLIGNNFSAPFYILQAITSDKQDLQNLDKLFNMRRSESKEILILNTSKQTAGINILQELSTAYPQYNFNFLNI